MLAASVAAAPAIAQSVSLDIPRGSLTDAIAALSAQAGISIGAGGALPVLRISAVHGRMTVDEALARMLAHSGWRARRVGERSWRIEPSSAREPAIAPAAHGRPARVEAQSADEIIVTGRKRAERLSDAPAALQIVGGDALGARASPADSATLATMVDGLSVTSLGAGRNRMFIRGVADSPFDGFGQASVSLVLDDARATYDAPDPDLRLVDVERVELLKGPQGPLYGTGALGGIYRVVTRHPDPTQFDASASVGMENVDRGGVGGHAQAMVNLPIGNSVAVRAVGYSLTEPGWIDTIGGARDINRSDTAGGRLALRVLPASGWTIDLSGALQFIAGRDSAYVDGTSLHARAPRAAEPEDVDFRLAALDIAGHLGTLAVTSVTSVSSQELRATYDAGASAVALGGTSPATYLDDRQYHVFNQEVRLASPAGHRLTWLAGLSLLEASTDASGILADSAGPRTVLTMRRTVRELAGFGEATFNWDARLSATLGGRLFHSYVEDRRREEGDIGSAANNEVHVAPSAALRWHDGSGDSLFVRVAGALRPGGAQAIIAGTGPGSYAADEISTTEFGARVDRPGLRLSATGFYSAWHDVQADYLRPDGLVTTRNAGDAVNHGVEVAIDWTAAPRLELAAGAIVQRGVLTRPAAPALATDDPRLPVVPAVALRASVARGFALGGWTSRGELRLSYAGAARLSFDPGLDRRIPPHGLVGLGLSSHRASWTVRLDADNLLDSSADSFGFGNPFSIRTAPQRTPLRPRSITLSIGREF